MPLRRYLARRLVAVAIILATVYFLLALPLAWYQVQLIYWNRPGAVQETLPRGWTLRRYVSQDRGIAFAAYVHEGDRGSPTVVYLHGRGEGFSIIDENTWSYRERGWTVVAPEYPGFAGMAGTPSETVIKVQMDKVHDDLMERGVDPRRLLIHGNSLGAGPALQLAQLPHGFLVLTAPVGSMRELVGSYVPYYPTILLRDKWDNWKRAATRFRAPAVVIHAVDDSVVPVAQGRRVAREGHTGYIELPSGGHLIADHGSMVEFGPKGFRFPLADRR